MTGENLLDEGRARSRHADNENRRVGGISEPLLCAHQLRRERRPDSFQPAQRRRFIVVGLAPLQRVAAEQVLK